MLEVVWNVKMELKRPEEEATFITNFDSISAIFEKKMYGSSFKL